MRNYADLRRALQADVGATDVMLTSDMTLETVNRFQLKNSILKKFQDEISSSADDTCLELFKKSNRKCLTVDLEPKSDFEEVLLGEVKRSFDDLFFTGPDLNVSFSDIMEGCSNGPGASLGVDSYNFYTKLFDSNLTCTSPLLYRYYRYFCGNDPKWKRAEETRSSTFGLVQIAGNRLSFVPKTSEVSRSICTEPLLNMFFQKGLGSVFQKLLFRRYRIDLSKQPDLNRRLAQKGSIDQSFGTIDLSSASDTMSLRMLKSIFPSYILAWIMQFRSPTVTYPDGSSEELHMVSSMGNGFTFPLQTLLFSTIVASVYRLKGINPLIDRLGPKNFGVFGDDIIVLKDAYVSVVRALQFFGFEVNETKSFNSGCFRESCGGDYWAGHDVRGVYIKSLTTSADVYSTINRIIRWSSRTGIFLTNTIRLLRSWVEFLPIPEEAGDSEGIKVPYPPANLKRNLATFGVRYAYLKKLDTSFRLPSDPATVMLYPRPKRRKIGFNPDGLLITVVGGFCRNGRVTVRSNSDKFKVRYRTTSSWGGSSAAGVFRHQESDWVITFNLYFAEV